MIPREMCPTIHLGARAVNHWPQAWGVQGAITAAGTGVHQVDRREEIAEMTQSFEVGICEAMRDVRYSLRLRLPEEEGAIRCAQTHHQSYRLVAHATLHLTRSHANHVHLRTLADLFVAQRIGKGHIKAFGSDIRGQAERGEVEGQ